tara:strand:- start:15676 stop:16071 length:396 start_codon:yes stop_codon:yes gene_type:complete
MTKNKIEDFLIISFTGQNDIIGLKINNNFFTKKFQTNIKNNKSLVNNILDFISEKKVEINENFSILVNVGPGSFSSIRISLAVAKGIKIAKRAKIYGFKSVHLSKFDLENIELLIKKNLIQNKLIKPLYLS